MVLAWKSVNDLMCSYLHVCPKCLNLGKTWHISGEIAITSFLFCFKSFKNVIEQYLAIMGCFEKVFGHHGLFAWLEQTSRSLYRFRQASASLVLPRHDQDASLAHIVSPPLLPPQNTIHIKIGHSEWNGFTSFSCFSQIFHLMLERSNYQGT